MNIKATLFLNLYVSVGTWEHQQKQKRIVSMIQESTLIGSQAASRVKPSHECIDLQSIPDLLFDFTCIPMDLVPFIHFEKVQLLYPILTRDAYTTLLNSKKDRCVLNMH